MKKISSDFAGAKVLLVEDYVINQELTMEMLRMMNCEVELSENGQDALDKFSPGKYDLVIMDIQIPEVDGYAVTKKIREQEKSSKKQTPIVALTANALEGDREKCLKAGMDDYISKPIKGETLETTLAKYLSK
jgi:CheY-like chemotaxis protein